jgi:hypothetical protein
MRLFGKRHKRLKPNANKGHGFPPWPFCFCDSLCRIYGGFATNHEEHGDCNGFTLFLSFVVSMKGGKRVTGKYKRRTQ